MTHFLTDHKGSSQAHGHVSLRLLVFPAFFPSLFSPWKGCASLLFCIRRWEQRRDALAPASLLDCSHPILSTSPPASPSPSPLSSTSSQPASQSTAPPLQVLSLSFGKCPCRGCKGRSLNPGQQHREDEEAPKGIFQHTQTTWAPESFPSDQAPAPKSHSAGHPTASQQTRKDPAETRKTPAAPLVHLLQHKRGISR